MRLPGYWVPAAVSIIAVLIFSLLGLSLYRTSISDVQDAVAGQTTVTAAAAASALASAVHNDLQLAATLAGEDGLDALVQRSASQPTINAVEFASLSIQRANPQLLGLYFYNHDGAFVMSQVVNPTHQPPHQLSIACDVTDTYCIDTNPPSGGYLGSAALQASLAHALQPGGLPTQTLAFDRRAGPFGYLFIMQPIHGPHRGAALGALVAQIDAASLFAPYVEATDSRVLVVDGNVVIDRTMHEYYDRGLLPVTQVDPTLSGAVTGGLVQVPVGISVPDRQAQITVHGARVVGSRVPVRDTMLQIISYAPAPAVPVSVGLLLGAALFVFMLVVAGAGGLSLFLRHQVQQLEYSRSPANAEASAGADAAAAQSRAEGIAGARAHDARALPPLRHTDRRHARRHPLDFPLRLRLGANLFPGRASNLSVGGIGLWFDPRPDVAHSLYRALASHERGAVELLHDDTRFIARVRIAHVNSLHAGTHVGMAFESSEEAERLIGWLEAGRIWKLW